MDEEAGGALHHLVRAVLDQLPERDAAIISYRFGIQDDEMHTLDDTSAEFGVAREAIRSIESGVLGAIRASNEKSPDD